MNSVRRLFVLFALALSATVIISACGGDTPPAAPADPTPTPVDAAPVDPGDPADPADPADPGDPAPAPVDDVSFEGQTVRLLVGFAPGGGYDTFARMAAQVLPRYLPGSPRVVVENLAGGGGLRGVQTLQRAAPDGLTAHIIHPRWMRRDLLGIEVPDFSIENTTWLGALGGEPTTSAHYARQNTAISWDDILALNRTVTSGATEPGSSGNMGAWFIELIGGPIQTLYGYGGTAEIAAAFDRGELDITYVANPQIAPRLFPEWAEQQLVAPLFYWQTPPEDDPQFMDWMEQLGTEPPPHLFDVANAEDWQEQTFESVVSVGVLTSRAFHLPPGVSPELTAAWRQAMEAVGRDTTFRELGDAAGYDTGFTGAELIESELPRIRQELTDERVYDLFLELSGGED